MSIDPKLVAKLRSYAHKYGIDENVAIAQIQQESNFNPRASSGKANGIAQFTPATARRFGVNVWDVDSSFEGWGKYMSFLLKRYRGDYEKALAGYNAGEGSVDRYHGVPPFAETQNYVRTILAKAGSNIATFVSNPQSVRPEKYVAKNPNVPKVILLATGTIVILLALAQLSKG